MYNQSYNFVILCETTIKEFSFIALAKEYFFNLTEYYIYNVIIYIEHLVIYRAGIISFQI